MSIIGYYANSYDPTKPPKGGDRVKFSEVFPIPRFVGHIFNYEDTYTVQELYYNKCFTNCLDAVGVLGRAIYPHRLILIEE